MEKTISATEAVRKFSEILSSIKYKGDRYVILRGGKPVAAIGPIDPEPRTTTLRELIHKLSMKPVLGEEEAESFRRDLEEIRRHQPSLPEGPPWD
jgi:antitoxin (DNA-binding transcriptional repressor) of toxin-antitoxin stability system